MTGRRRRTWTLCAEFAVVVAVVHVLGIPVLERNRWPEFEASRRYLETLREVPAPGDGWFVAYDKGSDDQFAVYHDLLGTREPLQRADVIALGNSRTQAALDPEVVIPYFEDRGLRFYDLAFGNGEHYVLPTAIFERFDLRPQFVLINIDSFFRDEPLGLAAETLAMSRFEAAKVVFEKNAGFAMRRLLHRVYPLLSYTGWSDWIIYRSIDHGVWDVFYTATRPLEVGPLQYQLPDTPEVRRAADRMAAQAGPILDWFSARGSQVVLIEVPAQRRNLGRLSLLAERVGYPFLEARLDRVVLIDRSHLDPRSAHRYSRGLVDSFEERFPAPGRSGSRGGSAVLPRAAFRDAGRR
jgi:hypothetical protein